MAEKKFSMTILAFTDSHGNEKIHKVLEEKAKQAHIIICLGDFTIFGDNTKKILKRFNGFGKPMLLIHGNHENPAEVRKYCEEFDNIMFMHGKVYEFKGVRFVGWGGEGFSHVDRKFEVAEKELAKLIGKKPFVFFTHQPPYDTELDPVGDQKTGSKTYRRFIEKQKPHLAISGHIEENERKHGMIDKTLIVNPGSTGTLLKI